MWQLEKAAKDWDWQIVAVIHDEVGIQMPYLDLDARTDMVDAMSDIMVKYMSEHLEIDMKVEAESMWRWFKFPPEGIDEFDPYTPLDPKPSYPYL